MAGPSSRLSSEEKLFSVYFAVHPLVHDFVLSNFPYLKLLAPNIPRDDFVETLESIITVGYTSLSSTDTEDDTTANQPKIPFSAEPTSCEGRNATRPGDNHSKIGPISTENIELGTTKTREEVCNTDELVGNLTSNTEDARVLPIEKLTQPCERPPVLMNNPQPIQNDYSVSKKRKYSAYDSTYDNAEHDAQSSSYADKAEQQIRGRDNKVHNSVTSKEHATLLSSNQTIATPTHRSLPRGSTFSNYVSRAEYDSLNWKRKNRQKTTKRKPNKSLNIDDEIHLPFGLQHQILRTVLRASEDCCHDWCATYAPSILEQNGWFHHKLGEMQKSRWFQAIVNEYILLGQGLGHDLEFLFDSAENVRHSYVHRDKGIPLRAFKNRIRQAVGLLQALRDYERAESVKRILKSLTRFSDHASQGGYFRELPIADQQLRRGVLSTSADYYGDVIGFITGRNELPHNYLLMDA